MLQNVVEAIEQWIHEMLEGFVLSNMETMYSDVNEKVGTIAAEVGKSPQSWNGAVFDLIRNFCHDAHSRCDHNIRPLL